jgi:hypothetical protein
MKDEIKNLTTDEHGWTRMGGEGRRHLKDKRNIELPNAQQGTTRPRTTGPLRKG